MDWKNFVGPATLVYMVTASIAGVWWASDLSTRVSASEKAVASASQASERIVRLETLVSQVDVQLNRIEEKLDRRNDH